MCTFTDDISGEKAEVIASVSYDFEAGVKYPILYVDNSPLILNVIDHYLKNPEELRKIGDGVESISGFHGTEEKISSKDLMFSNRLIVYTGFKISAEIRNKCIVVAKHMGIGLIIRDGNYIDQRISVQVPMAFISHDTRDKYPFVSELASKLQTMLCTVWYDEFSLVPGQSLRASIEDGLKKCKKCILILSPNFISNDGWTKAEFDSIFSREILEKKNVIIPVWHSVTKEQVYDYCPRLIEKVSISSDGKIENIAKQILRGINHD